MITTTVIVALSLALIGAGAVALVFGLVKTPFALIGSAVSAVLKPIKKLFSSKGGDKVARKAERKAKSGVEEVSTPAAAAAAA